MSLAQHPRVKTWTHLDERSAAYFAIGIARCLKEPVAMVTTSGTAAANVFPAVVEAHYSHTPFLILTADRPPELLDWGANQTIDQTRMYSGHAKWFVNLSTPKVTPDLLRYVRAMASRALSTALETPAGPVHVNFPFREPLVPEQVPSDFPEQVSSHAQDAWEGRRDGKPYTHLLTGCRVLSNEQVAKVAADLQDRRRGIIVCGPQDDLEFPFQVSRLANHLGFPILADPLSQVRCGGHERMNVIDYYDIFLRSEKLIGSLEPELILRFGATPTSSALLKYIERHQHAHQIIIQETDWSDPSHLATDVIHAVPTQFAKEMTAAIESTAPDRQWLERWLTLAARTRSAVHEQMLGIDQMFEGKIFTELAALIPSKGTLFAGNSMPVRYLDTFFPSSSQEIRFMANRGASGIDGVVSTTLGASSVSEHPTILVVGDISFYHDMNGLLAAKRHHLNALIIVANNDGGGIFSFLPQQQYKATFENYFATPHGLKFDSAASFYGLAYSNVTSWDEFRAVVAKNIGAPQTTIVEVPGDRQRNVELQRRIWSGAAEVASGLEV